MTTDGAQYLAGPTQPASANTGGVRFSTAVPLGNTLAGRLCQGVSLYQISGSEVLCKVPNGLISSTSRAAELSEIPWGGALAPAIEKAAHRSDSLAVLSCTTTVDLQSGPYAALVEPRQTACRARAIVVIAPQFTEVTVEFRGLAWGGSQLLQRSLRRPAVSIPTSQNRIDPWQVPHSWHRVAVPARSGPSKSGSCTEATVGVWRDSLLR
jgi:hypothetical protein